MRGGSFINNVGSFFTYKWIICIVFLFLLISTVSATVTQYNSTDGLYTIVKFNGTGSTTWTPPPNTTRVEYLVIGGGGAGGSPATYSACGGGGAGGFRTAINFPVAGTLTVTVGDGGSGNFDKGDDSVFSTITATGGGYGGSASGVAGQGDGGAGGSGGGNGYYGTPGGSSPVTIPVQGYSGGLGFSQRGGGGGGASQVGYDYNAGYNGGNGTASSITGTLVYYAGGGGGGNGFDGSTSNGIGGIGGGGTGSVKSYGREQTPGTDGLGGGGGGATLQSGGVWNYASEGGSGIVVIKYLTNGDPPVPDFSSNVTSGFYPFIVQFNDTSLYTPTGWAWLFGDEVWSPAIWNQQNASSGWSARYGQTVVKILDGSIILTGGHDGNYKNDTWRSIDNGITWTLMNASSGWSARLGQTTVALSDGSIILMGGNDGSASPWKNDTWRSIDKGATWTLINASSGWAGRQWHNSVALSDNSIVLLGGYNGPYYNDTWRSIDKGVTWTLMNVSSGWFPRLGQTSFGMSDNSIIMTSGADSVLGVRNDTWRSTNYGATWTLMNASGGWLGGHVGTGVAMFDGSIVFMDGYQDASIRFNETWRSTDNGITWIRINASSGWNARWHLTAVAMSDGSIIALGGYNGSASPYKNDTWRFNPVVSTVQNSSHTYTTLGKYNVSLQVYNSIGFNSTRKAEYIKSSVASYTSIDGLYTIVKFNNTGTTIWTNPIGINSVEYLIVGGGGSGGAGEIANPAGDGAGGGGAGGFRTCSTYSVISGSNYTVIIGIGGYPTNTTNQQGNNGSASVFDVISAAGGGFGAADDGGTFDIGGAGGSGGGGGGTCGSGNNAGGAGNTPNVTPFQGNAGGTAVDSSCNIRSGGGGGGAGVAGSPSASGKLAGRGGNGTNSTITGVNITYAGGGGGGGGGTTGTGGLGGTGGGGSGGAANVTGTSGTDEFGGGGGGSGSAKYVGGAGGSGIVILKYLTPVTPTANFTANVTVGPPPLVVQFNDTSINISAGWAWFFGDEPYTQAWVQQTTSAGWLSRYNPTMVVTPNGKIILMGGIGTGGLDYNDTWISSDNGTTWSLQNASSGWEKRSRHTSVITSDGSIILMGGTSVGVGFSDTWKSTNNGLTWTKINSSGGWNARASHSSTIMSNDTIILSGGYDYTASVYKNDTWRSTDKGVTWILMNASGGWSPREFPNIESLKDNSILLMGGGGGSGGDCLNDTWRSTNSGATWTLINASSGWTSAIGPTTDVMPDGSILLTGGYNGIIGAASNKMWRSTNNGVTWNLVNATSPSWTARWYLKSVVMPDGSLIIAGGSSAGSIFNDTWRFQPVGSSIKDPIHIYTNFGRYNVSLQVYNSVGYNLTRKINYIEVAVPPVANFTSNVTNVATLGSVQFNDTSTGNATSWGWCFGEDLCLDYGASHLQNPTSWYLNPGIYSVSFNATNGAGSSVMVKFNYIYVSDAIPVASFTMNNTIGLSGLPVGFTDTSTHIPALWNWSFGDGSYSSSKNPSHVFVGIGNYTVSLNATNIFGSSYVTHYVNITDPINASFISNAIGGISTPTITFTDTSTGSPTGWNWFFGDDPSLYSQAWVRQTASAAWSLRYKHTSVALPDGSIVLMGGSNGGAPYNDTWRSTDKGITWVQQNSSSGWSARQSSSSVVLSDGSIVLMGGYDASYTSSNDVWISTDQGVMWTQINTSAGWIGRGDHTTVILPNGNIILMGGYASPNPQNDVWKSIDNGITWTQVNVSAGWSARYSHSSVALSDGSVLVMGGVGAGLTRYNDVWKSTDNGTTWTQVTASAEWSARQDLHSILMPDNSIIILNSVTGTKKDDVWRSVNNGSAWTQINASAGWGGRDNPTCVGLSDGSIILMGGIISGGTNDVWRFQPVGSSLQNPSHTYTSIGNYSVFLRAFNSYNENTTPEPYYINVTYGPTALFNATPNPASIGTSISFVDMSTNGATSWNWTFGDGSGIFINQNVTHTYSTIGLFNVTLNVTHINGFSNYSLDVTIIPSTPIANFSIDHNIGSNPLTVVFTDTTTGSGITDWYWNFGDGTTSTTPSSVSHQYTILGTYYAQLTVTSFVGTNVSQPQIIYVVNSAIPISDFAGAPTSGSAPLSTQFTDLSVALSGVNAWNWSFGDGNYSNSQNPVHIYSSSGQYSVTLTATSGAFSNYTSKSGYINIGVLANTVSVDFIANTTYAPTYPATVQFTDQSVCNPVCTNWVWDFNGDGAVDSLAQNPTYTYTYPGNYSPKLIVSNGLNTGTRIRNLYITIGPAFVQPTIPQPTAAWKPGYQYNGTLLVFKGNANIDLPNSTYLKYWLQNFSTTRNFSVYGFALGVMAPIMHVFGFWIFLIIWGLYLFAVWIRSQDVTLPLIIGILTMGTFGLLFPQESLPVIIIMFVICGAIIITKLMKDSI